MEFSEFCCPNKACRDHGRYGLGNIALKERYGRKGTALLLCKTCRKTFSENRGTPFFKLRLSYDQLYQILTTLAQCGSVRGTAKIVGVNVKAVLRIIKVIGAHAEAFNDFMLQKLGMNQVQADEIWTYIKKEK